VNRGAKCALAACTVLGTLSQSVSKHVAKLGCAFYRTAGGDEPVRAWLRALDADICATIGKDILKIQWRWPISKPLVGTFGEGLYEVRSAHDGNIYRVFFCIEGREVDVARGRQRSFRRKS
jgi:hypothetical protein